MSDHSHEPYREPCGGPFPLFAPFVMESSGTVITKFENTATVPSPSGGDPIAPYERWTIDESGPGSCEEHNCGDIGPADAPCAPWIGVDQTTADIQYNPSSPGPNTFSSSGTVAFDFCRPLGFKNVQAMRSWHGAFPWTAPEAGCPTTICSNGTTPYQVYQAIPTQTKYLVATYDVHVRNSFAVGDDAGGSLSADKTGARTVNAMTGEITSGVITTQTTVENFEGTICNSFFSNGGAGYTNGDCSGEVDFPKGLTTVLDGVDTDLHCNFPLLRPDDPEFFLGDLITEWNDGSYAGGGGDNPFVPGSPMPAISDPNNYSFSGSGTINDGENTYGVDVSFSRTATTVTWNFLLTDNIDGGPPGSNSFNYYGTITLSSANTSDDVYTDVKSLLNYWPLDDDTLYPWRTDSVVSVAPLMARLEKQNTSPVGFNPYTVDDLTSPEDDSDGNAPFSPDWTPTYAQRSWFDTVTYQWQFAAGESEGTAAATGLIKMLDGSILGEPLPAGYQDFFDYYFLDWTGCCFNDGEGDQSWDLYQLGYGMNVSTFNGKCGAQLPLNATNWTNFSQARDKVDGAWLFYADQTGTYYAPDCPPSSDENVYFADGAGALFAQKYAVIMNQWPSQNFDRPGGMDKFSFDETQVYCAANASGSGPGSTWTITNFDTSTPPDGTDFSGTWGGPVVGGFYSVSSYSGGVLTLGSLVYNVPTGWTSAASGDDTSTCFGKLRFPDCPSLLGRAGASCSGTTFTFSTAQPTFGMAAAGTEQIDVFDASMSSLASNVTATRVDDSHFTTVSSYPTAAWVQIHGAPAWYMNDTQTKGDFLFLQWISDNRSIGEYTRLTGQVDCDGDPLTQPSENAGGGPVTQPFQYFCQHINCEDKDCLAFNCCRPRVICVSPNGESFLNGVTVGFPSMLSDGTNPSSSPSSYYMDEQYGSKWWGWPQVTMTDIFWQTPHKPCGFDNPDGDPVEVLDWQADPGTCPDDEDETTEGGSIIHHKYYASAPQVEARASVPCNYGAAQDECAPTLPSGIEIGWNSPVDTATGSPLPPQPATIVDSAVPQGSNTAWSVHATLCSENEAECRFVYSVPGC